VSVCLVVEDALFPAVESFFFPYLSETNDPYIVHVKTSGSIASPQVYSSQSSFEGSVLRVVSDEFIGTMNMELKEGTLEVKPTWAVGVISNFIKNIYSRIVFSAGGLMLHAAGLVKDNNAYIFFGPSESGKSTIASLSPEYLLLSDELIAVRPYNGTFNAYSTPTWGNSAYQKRVVENIEQGYLSTGFVPRGLFKLIQDSEVRTEKLSASHAAAELYTLPGMCDNGLFTGDLLKACTDLAITVPCYQLHFRKDNSFWRNIDECVG